VSRDLRQTIREMVEAGKSNQQIYRYVQNEYGPNQVAIPHQGYMHRISYGLPYVAVGGMFLIAYWLGWTWWIRGRDPSEESELSEEEKEQLDSVTETMDSPLR
jgi:cytochrome c-type biogenesis protein CcmH/NrfF